MTTTVIAPGLTNEIRHAVEDRHLANAWGSGLAAVLATPVMVAFFEECARLSVDPILPAGRQTVGTGVQLRHLAATPPGMTVTVRAELVEVDGRRLRFQMEAWDDVERVADGEHERFIIDVDRFQRRVKKKVQRAKG